MDLKTQILKQVHYLTASLIEVGLSVEQNFPSINDGCIYISGKHKLSNALKNVSYQEIYGLLESEKNYNIKMIDGALLQFIYTFNGSELIKYRLAFFPSPTLEEFQNNHEVYETDEIYADMLAKNIIPTPIRFDYDPSCFETLVHPASHLTIGQYQNCRIPVSMPITPNIFVDFILRNFYHPAQIKFLEKLKFDLKASFEECISAEERNILHMAIHT